MLRVVQYLSVGLLVLLPAQTLASPAEDASAVIDRQNVNAASAADCA